MKLNLNCMISPFFRQRAISGNTSQVPTALYVQARMAGSQHSWAAISQKLFLCRQVRSFTCPQKPRTWDSEVDFTKTQIAHHFRANYEKFQTLLLKTTSTTLIRPNGRCKAGSKAETSPKGKLFDSQHTVEGYSYVLTYFVSDGFGRS